MALWGETGSLITYLQVCVLVVTVLLIKSKRNIVNLLQNMFIVLKQDHIIKVQD
jgi:hypothetical protein